MREELTFQCALGLLKAQFARLLEGGKGFIDSCDGEFVGLDVEVANCMVDELFGQRKSAWGML